RKPVPLRSRGDGHSAHPLLRGRVHPRGGVRAAARRAALQRRRGDRRVPRRHRASVYSRGGVRRARQPEGHRDRRRRSHHQGVGPGRLRQGRFPSRRAGVSGPAREGAAQVAAPRRVAQTPGVRAMSLAPDLLEILVCPKCKGPLEHRTAPAEALVCHACRLIYAVPDPGDVEQRVLRSLPQLVVIDADDGPQGLALCGRLKADSYSAIVPLAVLTSRHTTDRVQEWFTAGADEVISPLFEPAEQASRLDGLMTRTARDVAVNPSTRLPGTTEIEREIRRRMENGELFAVCYADLDHFKEFNDRYSYNDGDRVIYIL